MQFIAGGCCTLPGMEPGYAAAPCSVCCSSPDPRQPQNARPPARRPSRQHISTFCGRTTAALHTTATTVTLTLFSSLPIFLSLPEHTCLHHHSFHVWVEHLLPAPVLLFYLALSLSLSVPALSFATPARHHGRAKAKGSLGCAAGPPQRCGAYTFPGRFSLFSLYSR